LNKKQRIERDQSTLHLSLARTPTSVQPVKDGRLV
jgi:hypothetical protein